MSYARMMELRELGLDLRTLTYLRRGGVNSVIALAGLTDRELLQIRGIRKARLLEIRKVLKVTPEEARRARRAWRRLRFAASHRGNVQIWKQRTEAVSCQEYAF